MWLFIEQLYFVTFYYQYVTIIITALSRLLHLKNYNWYFYFIISLILCQISFSYKCSTIFAVSVLSYYNYIAVRSRLNLHGYMSYWHKKFNLKVYFCFESLLFKGERPEVKESDQSLSVLCNQDMIKLQCPVRLLRNGLSESSAICFFVFNGTTNL